MLDPQTVVSLAEISQYLWANDLPKTSVFFNGVIDPRKAQQLYLERKALQYGIAQDLSGLEGVSMYVYALCGAKLSTAQEILATGSSGGSVIPGGGGQGVREYSTFATAGSTYVTFPEAINATLLYASRGGIDVGTIITSGTPTGNQVKWSADTGTLTVAADVAFYENEFVRILVKS
jgi:hypothetical protein